MTIQENISLAGYSTMRLGGNARYLTDITSRTELQQAVEWAEANNLKMIMIGSGSNIVWRDEGWGGLVMVNKIMGYHDFEEDDQNHYVTASAGENWDSVVEKTVGAGLSGIEALSLIPGTAGATPVQNVGAYGQDISKVLVSIEAYDTRTKSFVNIPAMDCAFGYRTSRFKTTDRGRFFITAVTLHLLKQNPSPPFYRAVEEYLSVRETKVFTPQIIRDAVIAIRTQKLPDPAQIANNGSFFANPVISAGQFVSLQASYPDIPHWDNDDGTVKIPAAWLIEHAGYKGLQDPETGMATWPNQPLVIVNQNARSTADLLRFTSKICDAVYDRYGITLIQEPELLP